MPVIELDAGPIAYEDTGGSGPVVVLCHGVPMDHRVWRKVVPRLPGLRVISPTLPLGGHRQPMRADADLTQLGVAGILADFLDALELVDVTLVLNDWGGGQFLINLERTDRIGRLVLVACEAFDNFPPGRAAEGLALAGRVPGAMRVLLQAMNRSRRIRRMPSGYGGMSLVGIPDDLLLDWFRPASTDGRIRRDFAKFAAGTPSKTRLRELAAGWSAFTRPVLVIWAAQDRLMPAEHGPRLAACYPDARLVVVDESSTLVPEDQPELLAQLIRDFVVDRRPGAPQSVSGLVDGTPQ